MRGRLGEVLQAEGWISREQAEWAVEVAARDGARIGSVLVAAGLVGRGDLYRVLARMWDCPYIDLTYAVLHPGLLDGLDPQELAAEGWFPVRYEAAGRHGAATVLVATCEEPTDEQAARIERRLGRPVTLHVTTDWDIVQRCTSGSARPSSNRRRSGSGAATAPNPPGRCSSPGRRCCSPSRASPCSRASPPHRAPR